MSVPNSTASPRSASTFADTEVFDGADELLRAWGRGVRPDADLTVSQWADAHRMLGSRASAEPGRQPMHPDLIVHPDLGLGPH